MRAIWKYKLQESDDLQKFDIPNPAAVCHVGLDADELVCVWLDIEDTSSIQMRQWTFRIYGTGHAIEMDDSFLASVKQGRFIWHVFIVKVTYTYKDGSKWREPFC